MMIDRLIDRIKALQNPTAIGLDTRLEYLPPGMLPGELNFKNAARAIFKFNKMLINAVYDIVPSVKIQSAYYEMYGYEGVKAFCDTAQYARGKGMIVIADCKRNDIGATAEAYATAYLGKTPLINKEAFEADFLTVNPYLGTDGILPFVTMCKLQDKGIFVLVKTSNPSSGELQDITCGSQTVYEMMGGYVQKWGEELVGTHGYSAVGAVVGATYPEQGAKLRQQLPSVFFLVPGYGAQGAGGKELAGMFDKEGGGAIVNASRSLICAYKQERYRGLEFDRAAREEALRMKEDIQSNIV
ncbi:MAG: orotidine-5'-phosphate decarboxylase [Christensenellales bacterium]